MYSCPSYSTDANFINLFSLIVSFTVFCASSSFYKKRNERKNIRAFRSFSSFNHEFVFLDIYQHLSSRKIFFFPGSKREFTSLKFNFEKLMERLRTKKKKMVNVNFSHRAKKILFLRFFPFRRLFNITVRVNVQIRGHEIHTFSISCKICTLMIKVTVQRI